MAVVETIRIEGDASEFLEEVKKINEAVDGLKGSIKKTSNAANKGFKGISNEVKQTTVATKKLGGSLKSLISGLKATAIAGLALGAIKGAINSSQEATDLFNKATAGLQGTVSGLFSWLKGDTTWDEYKTKLGNVLESTNNLIDAENRAKFAEVERMKIQLIAQTNAEKQRQTRDDDTKSIEARIEANNNLGAILKQQLIDEKAQVEIQITAAKLRFENSGLVEDEVAWRQKELELVDLNERLKSQESERLMNDNALRRESIAIRKEEIDMQAEAILLTGKELDTYVADSEVNLDSVTKQVQLNAIAKLQIEYDYYQRSMELRLKENNRMLLEMKRSGLTETAEYRALLAERLQLETEYSKTSLEFTTSIQDAKVQAISTALGQVGQLVGDNAVAGKGIALAETIISTYAGATKAFEQGGVFGYITGAGIIAAGLANAKKITETQIPNANDNTSMPMLSAPSQPAQFNIVGQSGTNQLLEGLAGQFNKPIRAYVVGGDVISESELQRKRIRTATFG
jgi:hypothetical protein